MKSKVQKSFVIAPIIFIYTFLCFGCIPRPITISGNSMSPTLNNGDVIFVKVTTEEVKRGEIVLMLHPTETYIMVARVIGLPNEEIRTFESKTYVNGQILNEPYIEAANNFRKLKEGNFKVENDYFFVMGDNRDNSLDSRYFGAVKRENILGRYYSTIKKAEK